MPNIYGNCVIDVPNPTCDPCLTDAELGGIRGVAFIHKDAIAAIQANPEITSQWGLFISQGLIFVIPETRGTFNGGEVVTRPGFGNKATVNVGFNFTLEYDDPSYKSNCGFYNQIAQSNMYHVAFLTETQVKISSKPVEITPTAPVTDNVEDQAVWHIIVNWQDKLQPCPFQAPEDVFICTDPSGVTLLQADATLETVIGDMFGQTLTAWISSGLKASVQVSNTLDPSAPMRIGLLIAKNRQDGQPSELSDYKLVYEIVMPGGIYSANASFKINIRPECVFQCAEIQPGIHQYVGVPCSTTGSQTASSVPDSEVLGAAFKALPNDVVAGQKYTLKGMLTVNGVTYVQPGAVGLGTPDIVWTDGVEPADPCTSPQLVIFDDHIPA